MIKVSVSVQVQKQTVQIVIDSLASVTFFDRQLIFSVILTKKQFDSLETTIRLHKTFPMC